MTIWNILSNLLMWFKYWKLPNYTKIRAFYIILIGWKSFIIDVDLIKSDLRVEYKIIYLVMPATRDIHSTNERAS